MSEFSDYPRTVLIGWLLRAFGMIVLWLCVLAFFIALAASWWAFDQVVVK